MNLGEAVDNLKLDEGIVGKSGGVRINWIGQSAGFDIFNYRGAGKQTAQIGDEADYLQLFMQVAEAIFRHSPDDFGSYLATSDIGGHKLYLREFGETDRERFKYSYVALMNAVKALPPEEKERDFSFLGEIIRVDTSEEKFEPEARKVARILDGKNKEEWANITENRYDFLKVDMRIFSLEKLHSWGFQTIKQNGELSPGRNCIRPVRPKARGSSRR
ncbi:MAG: hypothetical protein GY866_09875 [Proteobacteria bacterium]|nr:hypothetical protein [Pseudomonadota bacterium]